MNHYAMKVNSLYRGESEILSTSLSKNLCDSLCFLCEALCNNNVFLLHVKKGEDTKNHRENI